MDPGADPHDAPPGWLDEIAAAPGPPFLSMGLHPVAAAGWLDGTTGAELAAVLAAKRRVLAAHRPDVVAALPGTGEAAAELAGLVRAAVAAVAPAPAVPVAPAPVAEPAEDDPLVGAALVAAEDLCLLVPDGGGWVLAAGVVCFPSHWRLADKLGRPVAEVHGPVPHYAAELAARVDRFLDRLRPGRTVWRSNWLVHSDDRLYAPVPAPPPDPPLSAADAGDRLWLRSERQTLRRLPATGAIAFTIRTRQAPLAVVAARPRLRAAMAAAVAAWSDDLVAYRGGEAVRRPLLAWLAGPAG